MNLFPARVPWASVRTAGLVRGAGCWSPQQRTAPGLRGGAATSGRGGAGHFCLRHLAGLTVWMTEVSLLHGRGKQQDPHEDLPLARGRFWPETYLYGLVLWLRSTFLRNAKTSSPASAGLPSSGWSTPRAGWTALHGQWSLQGPWPK